MNDLSNFAKILIILGLVIICIGILLFIFNKIPFLGKLPGDILIKKGNFTFYFPLTTSILISILLSIILTLIIGKK